MGRKATGRTTRVIRVPNDFDENCAMHLLYDVLPLMQELSENLSTSPRNYALAKFLDCVEPKYLKPVCIGGSGKT